MIRSRCLTPSWSGCILVAVVLVGCAEPSAPVSPEAGPAFSLAATHPMKCPAEEGLSASATISARGGMVAVGGHSVVVPPGAVSRPTRITLTAPASRYLEVELNANGQESFEFRRPVEVTVSYARCGEIVDPAAVRSAWHVDAVTKEFLERMPGSDDRGAQAVSFATDHFSFFMIAT